MAAQSNTSTRERSSSRPASTGRRTNGNGSAFAWGSAGGMIGAAAAGAAIAIAANLGRKFIVHSMAGRGAWDETLAAEHRMALAIFDKLLATDETQTVKRAMLLAKLKHALDKHEHEEEHVVYPALRLANDAHDADLLQTEHGHVDTYLYELESMPKDSPEWIGKVGEFRAAVAKHARMEEEQVFPRLKQAMSEQQNARLTKKVNQDGMMMA